MKPKVDVKVEVKGGLWFSRLRKAAGNPNHDSGSGQFSSGGGGSDHDTERTRPAPPKLDGGQIPDNYKALKKKAGKVAKKLLAKIKDVPKAIWKKAKATVAKHYQRLESRYGKKVALAVIGAGLLGVPVPVPGASFIAAAPILAGAELYRAFMREALYVTFKDEGDVDMTKIKKLADKFWTKTLAVYNAQLDPDNYPDDDKDGGNPNHDAGGRFSSGGGSGSGAGGGSASAASQVAISTNDKPKADGDRADISHLPPLRRQYIRSVWGIAGHAQKLQESGKSEEEVAKACHQARRDVGEHFKDLTPEDLRQTIYERNTKIYGDKLGPTVDYLKTVKGYSWQTMIDKSSTPGGSDLGLAAKPAAAA